MKHRNRSFRWFFPILILLIVATASFYKGARMMGESWAEVMPTNVT